KAWDFVQAPLSRGPRRGRISHPARWGDRYGTRNPVAIDPATGRKSGPWPAGQRDLLVLRRGRGTGRELPAPDPGNRPLRPLGTVRVLRPGALALHPRHAH